MCTGEIQAWMTAPAAEDAGGDEAAERKKGNFG